MRPTVEISIVGFSFRGSWLTLIVMWSNMGWIANCCAPNCYLASVYKSFSYTDTTFIGFFFLQTLSFRTQNLFCKTWGLEKCITGVGWYSRETCRGGRCFKTNLGLYQRQQACYYLHILIACAWHKTSLGFSFSPNLKYKHIKKGSCYKAGPGLFMTPKQRPQLFKAAATGTWWLCRLPSSLVVVLHLCNIYYRDPTTKTHTIIQTEQWHV